MMRLIEAFNEKETKERLYDIMNYLTGRTTISFHDIYDRLGRERVHYTKYHRGNGEFIRNFFTFPVMYPQNSDKTAERKVDELFALYTDAFNIGKYFHFKSDRDADERMIINLYTQFEATELVHGLLYCANDYISRIKFFAVKQATPEKFLKCDKVVIYYDRQYRNHIYECVKTVADKGEIVFKKELSAFYHIAGDDEGKYPVGIGVELMASSFTENRAAEILEALTGVKFNKSDNKDRQHNIVSLPCEESFFDALYNNITSRLPAINH